MFKRKLTALKYPSEGNLDINDRQQFRSMVLWLEEQRIRHYKIEERESLRQLAAPEWEEAYGRYKVDLACSVTSGSAAEELEWFLAYAIRLEYCDDVEKYKKVKKEQPQAVVPQMVSANPLDKLDFQSEEFKAGVNNLAKLLNVTCHPDHLLTLTAISKLIQTRFCPDALEKSESIINKGVPFPIQEADLGFDTGDNVLNTACKVLRLLYIHDLRELQTKINECIVSTQALTADPKTDTRLGKVGR